MFYLIKTTSKDIVLRRFSSDNTNKCVLSALQTIVHGHYTNIVGKRPLMVLNSVQFRPPPTDQSWLAFAKRFPVIVPFRSTRVMYYLNGQTKCDHIVWTGACSFIVSGIREFREFRGQFESSWKISETKKKRYLKNAMGPSGVGIGKMNFLPITSRFGKKCVKKK